MEETNFRYFEFGEFRLDAHRRILQKNGTTVHLTPRSFDLLCVMVENAGRVLEHNELLDKVWDDAFVEQSNLKKTISVLRQALGESPEASEFITTVPRRGYRFSATVHPFTDEAILIRETRAEIIVEEIEETSEKKTLTAAPTNLLDKIKRHKIAGALVFLLALFATSLLAWHFLKSIGQRFSVEKLRQTKLLTANSLTNGVLSGDGNFFVYTTVDKESSSLWTKDTATGGATQIFQMRNSYFWFFTLTPDSKYVYFTINNREDATKNGFYRIPIIGGTPELIYEKNIRDPRFSPDGTRLAVVQIFNEENVDQAKLLTMKPDGSDEKEILTLPKYKLFRNFGWSPDGNSLTFAVKIQPPNEKAKSYVADIPANGGTERIILPEQEKLFFFNCWLPDANSFLLGLREENAEIYQIWQYFPGGGEMNRVTNDDFSYSVSSISQDGKIIGTVRSFGLKSIWISDGDNFDFKQIVSGTNAFHSLSWTADGRLVISSLEKGKEVVAIMNADGSQKRNLTKGDDGVRLFPLISQDGKHIVFHSEKSGDRQVWRMDLDGRNLTQLTKGANVGETKLLSDGQTLIYSAYTKMATWTLIKQTADGQTIQLTDTNTHEWDVSPNEKYFAYFGVHEQTQKIYLYVRDLQTGETLKTFDTENGNLVRWTPDNQVLTYTRKKNGVSEIIRQSLDGGEPQVLTTVRGELISNFYWSPDGKHIALVRNNNQAEAILIQSDETR